MTVLNRDVHGIGGITAGDVEPREQDIQAEECVGHMVVFFPKFTKIGKAAIWKSNIDTFSNSPEAAKTKFLDSLADGEDWDKYEAAGWKIRRVRVVDAGIDN